MICGAGRRPATYSEEITAAGLNQATTRAVSEGNEGVTLMAAGPAGRERAGSGGQPWTRYLVVLTEVRPLRGTGVAGRAESSGAAPAGGAAVDRAAAERIATAFRAFGMVRAGRQRVKIIAVGP